jgi:hypothetical protein
MATEKTLATKAHAKKSKKAPKPKAAPRRAAATPKKKGAKAKAAPAKAKKVVAKRRPAPAKAAPAKRKKAPPPTRRKPAKKAAARPRPTRAEARRPVPKKRSPAPKKRPVEARRGGKKARAPEPAVRAGKRLKKVLAAAKRAPAARKAAAAKKPLAREKKALKPRKLAKKEPPKELRAGKRSAPPPPPEPKKKKKLKAPPPPPPSAKALPSKPGARGQAAAKAEAGRASQRPPAPSKPAPASKSVPPARPSGGKRSKEAARAVAPVRRPERPSLREPPRVAAIPLPTIAPPKRLSMEERAVIIERRLAEQTDDFRKRYHDSFLMSWIYHDAALEGVVYTYEELRGGLSGQPAPTGDSGLQPTYDDIRRTKEAVEYIRDLADKKRLPITVDVIKKIYLILHPEEGDIKTVKYRKDIPQHRLYFHEYAPPDKIAYKIRQIVDWLNDPETRKTRNLVRIAARVHYDLLRVYPFPTDSGKVARLFMNLMLTRGGMPPAIIHSTERQRYYEALKGSANTVLQMVQESVENSLASVEKLLDEHESKKRAFIS